MTIDLDELEAKARAATPGPWTHEMGSTVTASSKVVAYELDAADADFIAVTNPAAMLELVARLREVEGELAALKLKLKE